MRRRSSSGAGGTSRATSRTPPTDCSTAPSPPPSTCFRRSRESSRSPSRSRSRSERISSAARSIGTPAAAPSSSSSRSRWRTQASAPSPVSASMRRTPEATPRSETTSKSPISPVLRTWQPPHSSSEKPGTVDGAHALAVLLAEQRHGAGGDGLLVGNVVLDLHRLGAANPIVHDLLHIAQLLLGKGLRSVKSKRSRSGATSEPAW